jgi:hypothetical protein
MRAVAADPRIERMLGHRDTDQVLHSSEEVVMEDAVIVGAVRTAVGSFGGLSFEKAGHGP